MSTGFIISKSLALIAITEGLSRDNLSSFGIVLTNKLEAKFVNGGIFLPVPDTEPAFAIVQLQPDPEV